MVKSLYVHIPFCRKFCSYCDFPKLLLDSNFQDRYIDALLKEDERYFGYDFDTIFLGGGTPSCISLKNIEKLVTNLIKRHGKPCEFSIECNPEDINEEFVSCIKSLEINRVSIGLQTTDNIQLKKLGRNHTYEDCLKSVELLYKNGINNVSVDFIYGLPNQTINDIKKDIEAIKIMNLKHVSFYSLQVEKHTKLYYQHVKEFNGDLLADFYEYINEQLNDLGLKRYEVSNFAIPSYECKHNLCYWKFNDYAAIGIGATSFENGIREVRTQNLTKYFNGEYILDKTIENNETKEFEYLMLNLRLEEGFSLLDFKNRFKSDFLIKYKDKIEKNKEYFDIGTENFKIKSNYIYILNDILLELLDFENVE